MSTAIVRRSRRIARQHAPIPYTTEEVRDHDRMIRLLRSRWPNDRSIHRRGRQSRGIQRRGMTCYLLTTLQTLAHLPKFMAWVSEHNSLRTVNGVHTHTNPCTGFCYVVGSGGQIDKTFFFCFACAMKRFFEYYWSDRDLDPNTGNPLAIPHNHEVLRDILQVAQFIFQGQQSDPNEMFEKIVDLVCQSTDYTNDNTYHRWVETEKALFRLNLRTFRYCSNDQCQHSHTPEEVDEGAHRGFPSIPFKVRGNDDIKASIERAAFTQEDLPDFACHACGQTDTTTIHRVIMSAPAILRINLGLHHPTVGKILNPIQIPEHLNLSEHHWSDVPLKYRLYSVINHNGNLNGGHYIATVKGPKDVWTIDDDQKASAPPNSRSTDLCQNPTRWRNRDFQAFSLTYVKVDNRELNRLREDPLRHVEILPRRP